MVRAARSAWPASSKRRFSPTSSAASLSPLAAEVPAARSSGSSSLEACRWSSPALVRPAQQPRALPQRERPSPALASPTAESAEQSAHRCLWCAGASGSSLLWACRWSSPALVRPAQQPRALPQPARPSPALASPMEESAERPAHRCLWCAGASGTSPPQPRARSTGPSAHADVRAWAHARLSACQRSESAPQLARRWEGEWASQGAARRAPGASGDQQRALARCG